MTRRNITSLIAITVIIMTGNISYSQEENAVLPASQKMAGVHVSVKIVLVNQEEKIFQYDFNIVEGQQSSYKYGTTTPYKSIDEKAKEAPPSVSFLDLGTKIWLKPESSENKIIVNAKVNMCKEISKFDNQIPVMSCFEYEGVSVHPSKDYLKVFSGIFSESGQPIELYLLAEPI